MSNQEQRFRSGCATMNFEIALSSINIWVAETKYKSLSPWEKEIFRHSWEGDKYDDMNIYGYSIDYIRKILAPKLWKLLSEVIGETVTKKNLRIVIESALEKRNSQRFSPSPKFTLSYRRDTSNVDETTVHNIIAGNCYKSLKLSLRSQSYKIFIGDVPLWMPTSDYCCYPDVMVIQGEPVYKGTNKTIITNPLLIVEVLSDSTKNYDKGDKFAGYRAIPGFREYILIEESKVHVEHYTKSADNQWLFREYRSKNYVINLAAIQAQISLHELYEDVEFDCIDRRLENLEKKRRTRIIYGRNLLLNQVRTDAETS